MARLQMVIGCRPGELCAIKPSMVERSEAVWEIHLGKHKTAYRGKQRTIYVGPKGQVILTPYLDRDIRLADSQDRIRDAERRVNEIDGELTSLRDCVVDEVEVAGAIREFDQQICDGIVKDQTELARLGPVSTLTLTQIMNLNHLASDIQEVARRKLACDVFVGKDVEQLRSRR